MRSKMYNNILNCKLKKFFWISVGLFSVLITFYLIVIKREVYEVSVQGRINNKHPQEVWEFMINFSNMMKLNPTIEEFDIKNESGSGDDWKYEVHYKEHLSYLPFIKNYATAKYSTKRWKNDYSIISHHTTCFKANLICVNSDSIFIFSGNDTRTKCIEKVRYECPILFSSLCHKEVMYQRHEIMKKLEQSFAT